MEIYTHTIDILARKTQRLRDDVLLRKARLSLKHLSDHMKRDIGIADGRSSLSTSGFFSKRTKHTRGW